jgi:hypothetical protein
VLQLHGFDELFVVILGLGALAKHLEFVFKIALANRLNEFLNGECFLQFHEALVITSI